jgi:ribosomal protein S18 acetylase RimI-like enzyme
MMRLRPRDSADDLVSIQALEMEARARYRDNPNLAFVAAGPPFALERLQTGDLVVADDDGRIVGFILTTPMDGGLYIANISVAAECAGRGIGAALLESALERAAASGTGAVMLTTFRAPKWNGSWFRRFGFTSMPEDRIGPGLRAVLERQAKFVDPATRETLWRQID